MLFNPKVCVALKYAKLFNVLLKTIKLIVINEPFSNQFYVLGLMQCFPENPLIMHSIILSLQRMLGQHFPDSLVKAMYWMEMLHSPGSKLGENIT